MSSLTRFSYELWPRLEWFDMSLNLLRCSFMIYFSLWVELCFLILAKGLLLLVLWCEEGEGSRLCLATLFLALSTSSLSSSTIGCATSDNTPLL